MALAIDYINCRAIVQDPGRDLTIADTKILEFDRNSRMISLRKSAFPKQLPERVTLLIFHENSLHEYEGIIRKVSPSSGTVDISLFSGKEKEDRAAKRYVVNALGQVQGLVVANRLMPLREPLPVLVVNLSSSGCLIRHGLGAPLNVGTIFTLSLNVQDTDALMRTQVVYIKKHDAQLADYGCRFLFSE